MTLVMNYKVKRDRDNLLYVYESTDMMPAEGNNEAVAYKKSITFSVKKGDVVERALVESLGFMDTSLFREVPFTPNVTIATISA